MRYYFNLRFSSTHSYYTVQYTFYSTLVQLYTGYPVPSGRLAGNALSHMMEPSRVLCFPPPAARSWAPALGRREGPLASPSIFRRRGLPFNTADWTSAPFLSRDVLCPESRRTCFHCGDAQFGAASSREGGILPHERSNIFSFLQSRWPLERRLLNAHVQSSSIAMQMTSLPHVGGPVDNPLSRGSMYLQNKASLLHGADQIDYLVRHGKLPRDFMAIAKAYRATVDIMVRKMTSGEAGQDSDVHFGAENKCFLRLTELLVSQHWLFNTLIYFPGPSIPLWAHRGSAAHGSAQNIENMFGSRTDANSKQRCHSAYRPSTQGSTGPTWRTSSSEEKWWWSTSF